MEKNYPLEYNQLMIVRPNHFGNYAKYGHYVVVLRNVASTEKGIFAECYYVKDSIVHEITIPLFLLWRIADEEDLLEQHENYIHSLSLKSS